MAGRTKVKRSPFKEIEKQWSQLGEAEIERAVLEAIEETGKLLVQELQTRIQRQMSRPDDKTNDTAMPEHWSEAHDLAQYVKVFQLDGKIVVGIPPGTKYKGKDASQVAFDLDYGADPLKPAVTILKATLRDMEFRLDAEFKSRLRVKLIQMRGI